MVGSVSTCKVLGLRHNTGTVLYPESLLDKCRLIVFLNDLLKRPKLREHRSLLLPSLAPGRILYGPTSWRTATVGIGFPIWQLLGTSFFPTAARLLSMGQFCLD